MEALKDIAQIIFYLSLSVSGPLAVWEYIKARRRERLAEEFKVYNELDNRLFEYQKLALLHPDLDILDVAGLEGEPGRNGQRRREIIAHTMLFALFERAFLMFKNHTARFQDKQWSGWQLFLDEVLQREGIRASWQRARHTFDTEFQAFMDGKVEASAISGGKSSCPSR